MIRFGCDVLCDGAARRRWPARVALLTNDAARLAGDPSVPSRVALQRAGVPLTLLLSPEHGLNAAAADGARVADGVDAVTGLPVVSLYGDRFAPTEAMLAEVDAVLIDLPDIGTRFYTYAWSALHTLEACAPVGVPVLVLDRPNPLGGLLDTAEGPVLDVARFGSFVGRDAIPVRHALTLGELMRLWCAERVPGAMLEVVPCAGWRRDMYWGDTDLPFTPTSPSMPSWHSALLYPGLGLFEATNPSVGRGTPHPFRCIGAPWLRAEAVVDAMTARCLPGVSFAAADVVPTLAPFAGVPCRAVEVRVHDVRAVRPVALGLVLLGVVRALHPEHVRWADYPTAANPTGYGHFEHLLGVDGVRLALEAGVPTPDTVLAWTRCDGWAERVTPHLLYA